jgi:hypothetical protein
MKNFLSRTDLAIWLVMIAARVILCFCINVMIRDLSIRLGWISLRIRAVSRYLRRGDACESEDIIGRNFGGGFGRNVPDGGRGRCARAYLQTQSSLPVFWNTKNSPLSARQALLVTSEGIELRAPDKKDCTEAL